MGLFDYVTVSGPEYVCSEGHLLEADFQTKDLGQTMGHARLGGVGSRLDFESGGYGDDIRRPFLGRIYVYTACTQCPAFVQAGTHNLVDCWVEFEVEVVDDVVRSVKRVSPDTSTWLKEEPTKEWMKGAHGPMPHKEAQELHRFGMRPGEVCSCGASREWRAQR